MWWCERHSAFPAQGLDDGGQSPGRVDDVGMAVAENLPAALERVLQQVACAGGRTDTDESAGEIVG